MTPTPDLTARAIARRGGQILARLAMLYVAVEESDDDAVEVTMANVKQFISDNNLQAFFDEARDDLISLRAAERN